MTGILSTLIVFNKLREYFDINMSRLIIMLCMYAAGFGVYVGRFLRWNSWDVALRPMHLLNTIADHALHPADYKLAYGVTLLSGSLLFAIFLFFEAIVQPPVTIAPLQQPEADTQPSATARKPQARMHDREVLMAAGQ